MAFTLMVVAGRGLTGQFLNQADSRSRQQYASAMALDIVSLIVLTVIGVLAIQGNASFLSPAAAHTMLGVTLGVGVPVVLANLFAQCCLKCSERNR